MGRTRLTALAGVVAMCAWGCATGPLLENPAFLRPDPTVNVENPVYLPQGGQFYNTVFEKVLDVVTDYYEIAYANRYDGRIETHPRTAPGLVQLWRPGSPDFYQRLLATTQSIRSYARVRIDAASDGGFFVDVKVYKELENLPRPIRATAGAASFQGDSTVERQFEVINPNVTESNWIPLGRDHELEQLLLQRLRKCM